jgi:DNA replication and repair protein RecF
LALRTTARGPHRDSLSIVVNGRAAESYASEGQQRCAVLALKLAQYNLVTAAHGRPPIVLIDDVFGELDPVRRRALIDSLPAATQCFVTTTSMRWIDESAVALPRYRMEAGKLQPLD